MKGFQRHFFAWSIVIAALTFYGQLPWWLKDSSLNGYVPPFLSVLDPAQPTHLGFEHVNIAKSLANHGTFADPFADLTGPTTWLAPVMPFCLAVMLELSGGSRPLTTVAFVSMQILMIAFACTVVQRQVRGFASWPIWLTAFATVMITDFQWLFQYTHDSVFLSMFVSVVLEFYNRQNGTPSASAKTAIAWGSFGGLTALASPILGLGWAASVAVCWSKQWRVLILTGLATTIVVAPWTVRNYLVFGKMIPIKGNAAFEAWQGQLGTPHGLVTLGSEMSHPSRNGTIEGDQYRELGETVYLERKRAAFVESAFGTMDGLTEYVRRCINRLSAASVSYYVCWPIYGNGWFYRVQKWVYPTAFAGFLLSFVVRPSINPTVLAASQTIYVFSLLPYVLVSFYHRYTAALFPIRMLFCVIAIGSFFTLLSTIHKLQISTKSPTAV